MQVAPKEFVKDLRAWMRGAPPSSRFATNMDRYAQLVGGNVGRRIGGDVPESLTRWAFGTPDDYREWITAAG